MTDLVRDLRICYEQEHDELHRKAADEIERLRGWLREIVDTAEGVYEARQMAKAALAGTASQPSERLCACIPMAPRPWRYCQDCGGSIRPADNQPSAVECYSDPYLLDTAEKVEWANRHVKLAQQKWRLGDSCHHRPADNQSAQKKAAPRLPPSAASSPYE